MTKRKSCYIGEGFIPSQLLYIIPIVHGYCRRLDINHIIISSPLPREIAEHPMLSPILNSYSLSIPQEEKSTWFKKLVRLAFALKCFPYALRLAVQADRLGLKAELSWYRSQLLHSIWDTALVDAPDGSINLTIFRRLNAAFRVLYKVNYAQKIISDYGVICGFLGHNVCAARGLLAEFRRSKIRTFTHVGSVVHLNYLTHDASFWFLPRKDWDAVLDLADNYEVENYWSKRLSGESSYAEAELAYKSNVCINIQTPKNLMLLHIFRDSPFYYIDRTRIFADFTEWAVVSLMLMARSSEKWLIKTHPSATRWGENQNSWLEKICKIHFNNRWPSNVIINGSDYSNFELLQNARRVVTYSGTVHLEAACFGIRPIAVSEVPLHFYNADLVLKPKSIQEYEELMLGSQLDDRFRLSLSEIHTARRLLHCQENLLDFSSNVGSYPVFLGDEIKKYQRDWSSVNSKLADCVPMLEKAGEALASGLPRTVNFSILDSWIDKYFAISSDGSERCETE